MNIYDKAFKGKWRWQRGEKPKELIVSEKRYEKWIKANNVTDIEIIKNGLEYN